MTLTSKLKHDNHYSRSNVLLTVYTADYCCLECDAVQSGHITDDSSRRNANLKSHRIHEFPTQRNQESNSHITVDPTGRKLHPTILCEYALTNKI